MCTHPRVNWDLTSVIQKKGASIQEFIQHFCNKRNIIPEVNEGTQGSSRRDSGIWP
jgi:hypothetical protein